MDTGDHFPSDPGGLRVNLTTPSGDEVENKWKLTYLSSVHIWVIYLCGYFTKVCTEYVGLRLTAIYRLHKLRGFE
jgi:hypothetical protein